MIFDSFDCEFMKLCGLCRYLPIDLNERFSSPVLSQRLKDNLYKQGLISIQNNGLSCKLTTAGKEILADMGYKFASDSRMNINSQGYRRKLINAKWNVLLYLAGINVYTKNVKELADNEQGYISSLMLRGDDKIRVLAGTRFHGLLKIRDAVYVPYHIEGSDDWIIPRHEKEVFTGQITALHEIKRLRLILFADTLEELWEYIHPKNRRTPLTYGRKRFESALKELGYETLMIPLNFNGVTQIKILSVRGYGKRIARALGCPPEVPEEYKRCDGVLEGTPYITAVDMNADRIQSVLYQIKLHDESVVPKVVCLSFQRNLLLKILRHYDCQKCIVLTLRDGDLLKVFPELDKPHIEKQPFITEEGKFIDV